MNKFERKKKHVRRSRIMLTSSYHRKSLWINPKKIQCLELDDRRTCLFDWCFACFWRGEADDAFAVVAVAALGVGALVATVGVGFIFACSI